MPNLPTWFFDTENELEMSFQKGNILLLPHFTSLVSLRPFNSSLVSLQMWLLCQRCAGQPDGSAGELTLYSWALFGTYCI